MAYEAIYESDVATATPGRPGRWHRRREVIWRLPRPTADRPHGLKYRLQAHKAGRTLVRYDNETGKGDHRHVGRRESVYVFTDMETLIEDFIHDVERLGGQHA